MWKLIVLCLALSGLPVHAFADDPIILAPILVDANGDPLDIDYQVAFYLPDAVCTYVSRCGPAVWWTQEGRPLGCSRTNCTGQCRSCDGYGPAWLCVAQQGQQCHVGDLPNRIDCGNEARYACTTTPQPGQPPTSACYCNLGALVGDDHRVCSYMPECEHS
jgi:hypothetical protein